MMNGRIKKVLIATLISIPALASVVSTQEIKPGGVSMPQGGDPSLTIWTGDSTSLDMYYIGHDGNLWTSWYTGTAWVSRDNLGNSGSQSNFAPISTSAYGWEFTAWGTNYADNPNYPLWTECYNPGSGAFERGQSVAGMVNGGGYAVASWDGFGLDYFYSSARGISHKVFSYGTWDWTYEDQLTTGIPFSIKCANYVPSQGCTYVYGKSFQTQELYYFAYWGQEGLNCISAQNLQINVGPFDPALVWANDKTHVFWINSNYHLMHLSGSATQDLGGITTPGDYFYGSPAVASRGDGRIDIVLPTANGYYHHWVYVDDGL